MVSLGPSLFYHNQNYSDYRSASVISITNPEYVIRICNMIDFGHDWLRMDQDLLYLTTRDNFTHNLQHLIYNSKCFWRTGKKIQKRERERVKRLAKHFIPKNWWKLYCLKREKRKQKFRLIIYKIFDIVGYRVIVQYTNILPFDNKIG